MDESVIQVLFLIVMFVGVLGAILPVLPGAPIAFGALITAKFLHFSDLSWWLIAGFGVLTLLGILMDYLIPIVATKKMGGSKYGIVGMILGLIVGIIFAPFGFVSIIISPFLGALIGELVYDTKNHKRALTAALGSVVGYALTSSYGLLLSLSMFAVYLFYDVLN